MRSRSSRWRIPFFGDSDPGPYILLTVILLVASALRWYGLAWDEGYLFHPDERQILLVASSLNIPHSLGEFLSASSPLNPHFFAYGSLPIYLLRLVAPLAPPASITGPWADDSLARWIIFARGISGLFDLGTILMSFLLGRRLYGSGVGLVAAACVAVTVLHIQLSHFYAVDTLLTFLVLATLYSALRLAEKPSSAWKILCAVTFGLALATKISAAPLLFPIMFALWHAAGQGKALAPDARSSSSRRTWTSKANDTRSITRSAPLREGVLYLGYIWLAIRRPFLQICGIAILVFVLAQPYVLIDWYEFGRDVIREGLVARGWLDFPYTRQYATSIPYVYQVVQSAVWGMGLPLGIFAWMGAALFLYEYWLGRGWRGAFVLSWALVYFVLVGAQYVKYPRYLLPLLPPLYIMAVQAMLSLHWRRVTMVVLFSFVLGTSLIYSAAFVSIYGQEHPWLTVSRWMFENLPSGSTVAVEEWDDALPAQVQVAQVTHRGSEFKTSTMSLYGPDDQAKIQGIANVLSQADVVVLASQRAYGSIGRLPARYPLTVRYYQAMFSGELGFDLAETATNFPMVAGISIADNPRAGLDFGTTLPIQGAAGPVWNWGFEDESLSVYDHPQPLVFRKSRVLGASQLYSILSRH